MHVGVDESAGSCVLNVDAPTPNVAALSARVTVFTGLFCAPHRLGEVVAHGERALSQRGDGRVEVEDVPTATLGVEVKD